MFFCSEIKRINGSLQLISNKKKNLCTKQTIFLSMEVLICSPCSPAHSAHPCDVLQGMNSKRSIAICLSTRQSGYQQMLHDKVGCNVIYSKLYGSGTLYALMLQKAKTHVTLDNALVDLDAAINMGSGGTGTNFVSVSVMLSGKIKTFSAGEHARDEHFKAIFLSDNPGGGRKLSICPDVEIWTPLLEEEARMEEDEQGVLEDVRVQYEVMRQDPAAFGASADGASAASGSGSKHIEVHFYLQADLIRLV
jgi:hypothetical protein